MMVIFLAALLLLPAAAAAQDAPSLRAHHVVIDAGATWSGAYDLGGLDAILRGNGPGATPPPFTLFSAESRMSDAAGPELRLGFAVTRRLSIEAGAAWSRPHIGVAIRADVEAPEQELPGEAIQQYTFSGGASWQLPVPMGARVAPFVAGGAAFLRQLHEDRTLAEAGEIYYAGAGARWWWRGGHGDSRALGLRGDARINLRRNGIDFENTMRTYPTFSLALFIGL